MFLYVIFINNVVAICGFIKFITELNNLLLVIDFFNNFHIHTMVLEQFLFIL